MHHLDERLDRLPNTRKLVEAVLQIMPDHEAYLRKSFRERTPAIDDLTEENAELILRIEAGATQRLARGYRWLCEMIAEEELFFRRTATYRNTSFADVDGRVYQDRDAMGRYMDGLLVSEVLWIQHARAMFFYVDTFLPSLPQESRHLEVGPGHGLLLYHAAMNPRCACLTGWDVSPASLDQTAACLNMMQITNSLVLERRDIMTPVNVEQPFDSIVVSEVLEHLEQPEDALRNLHGCLSPRGRLYVNVPMNAPTIDHIYLFRDPLEVVELVERAGFIVDELLCAPGDGYTLARSRKLQASVTVVLVARRRP